MRQGESSGSLPNYFLLAAKNAARLSAHHEAVKLARRGLGQLKSLPEDTERMRRELGLQVALAYSLFLIEGYGMPEVEQTFQRAQDLAQKTGQAEELFGILRGLVFLLLYSGRITGSARDHEASPAGGGAKRRSRPADRELSLERGPLLLHR